MLDVLFQEDKSLASQTHTDHYLNSSFRNMYFNMSENQQKSVTTEGNSRVSRSRHNHIFEDTTKHYTIDPMDTSDSQNGTG